MNVIRFGLLVSSFCIFSCSTYYQKNLKFNNEYASGEMEKAEKTLLKNKKEGEGKNRFLYFVNMGTVLQQLGKYEESNEWFEKAFIFTEDFHKEFLNEALSYVLNPTVKVYPGEDHEVLYVLYYKAINYIKLGDYEAALVECRRMNNLSYQLSDKYKSKNKFQADAFIHNLMGIIYDASNDYNNAFIAYRNAFKIYDSEYKKMFNLSAPVQLKQDLLRTAYLTGLYEELANYEKKFDLKYVHEDRKGKGDVLFFWNNGLGPVKSEWSITFSLDKGSLGLVTFSNPETNFTFPFYIGSGDEAKLGDLQFVRVVFPKYVERKPLYSRAELDVANVGKFQLEEAENINAISFKILKERMLKTFGETLLRVALKQVAAEALRKENEHLGTALSIFNAVTEKADTRNWQTLPFSISYTRMVLDEGSHDVSLNLLSDDNQGFNKSIPLIYQVKSGKTVFHNFSSLEVTFDSNKLEY